MWSQHPIEWNARKGRDKGVTTSEAGPEQIKIQKLN